jgi:hypothetical protein
MNDIPYILRLISKAKESIEEAERSIEHVKDALNDIEDFISNNQHIREALVPKVHPQIIS